METEQPVQAAVPADLNTPDKVLYGLTARQVAIMAGAAATLWLTYRILAPLVSPIVLLIAVIPMGALAVATAFGRRDGLPMDRWLVAAVRAARSPRRMVPAPAGISAAPRWAPVAQTDPGTTGTLAPLRLPAHAIGASGVIDVDGARIAVTAATTVNFELRTAAEQHALVDGMGRWLNALSGPVQVVVSTRRVDMHTYADQIDERLDRLPHPALADAAAGYAAFLRMLAEDRDPLDRHVLIAHHAAAAGDPAVVRRQAEQTARALTGLGAATAVLDGGQVTDALAGACDPWRHVGTGRTTPDAVITATHHEEP